MMSRSAIGESDRVRLLARAHLLPFVELSTGTRQRRCSKALPKAGLPSMPSAFALDVREADVDVLDPVRDQTPGQHIETALPGLGVVADDGQRLGRPGWRRRAALAETS